MLSRAAERIYWAGRYLERAENTARIVQQYSQLLLDLPAEVGVGWSELIEIFGAAAEFDARGAARDEQAILDFLLANDGGSSSLARCIHMARDNIRNSRDLLPQESWENSNELYQFALNELAQSMSGEDRFEVLSDCIGRCQQINGVLTGTMSHKEPLRFLTLGQNIERADMSSRIIDVAAAYLQYNERLVSRYGSTLWTNVLKSVSGFQMYRQYCQPAVEGPAVIDFLVNDTAFPRAIRACMRHAKRSAQQLPRHEGLLEVLLATEEFLPLTLPEALQGAAVTELMDELQIRLGEVHATVAATWFLPQD